MEISKSVSKSFETWFMFIVILLVTNLFSIYVFGFEKPINFLLAEDGVFENLSAFLYFVAAIICFGGVFKQPRPRKYWCLFFAVLFFFVAGEEISWGQRIFEIATPEKLYSVNVQGEFNIHNINGIHQNIRLVGALFLSLFCTFIPISNFLSPRLRDLYTRWGVPICSASTIFCITIALILMLIARLFVDQFAHSTFFLDEIGEFILSLGWVPFAISNGLLQRSPLKASSPLLNSRFNGQPVDLDASGKVPK